MYGFPSKIHKVDVLLGTILCMVGSVQRALAKRLVEILDPVLKFNSDNPDSFQFASYICKLQRTTGTSFLAPFDICSVFTNVPLDETFGICAEYLYRGCLKALSFPETVFVELIEKSTMSVSLSFNNNMYRKIYGVSMSSPQGPLIANIFLGFHERQLSDKVSNHTAIFLMLITHLQLFHHITRQKKII